VSDPINEEQLERLLAGESSPAEEAAFRRAAADRSGRSDALELMRAVLREDRQWRAIARSLGSGVGEGVARSAEVVRGRPRFAPQLGASASRWRPARLIAASLLIGAVAALGWVVFGGGRVSLRAGGELAWQTAATRSGQRAMVMLPDGTRINLAPASSVRYAWVDGASRQDVYLEGEAYFEVVHRPGRTFAVHAAGVVTEDIGTAFDVRAYGGDGAVRVAVRSGSVAVRGRAEGDGGGVVLRAGEVARADSVHVPVRLAEDADAYFGWTEGRLVFHRVTVAEIVPQLERWYDLEIRVPDPALREQVLTFSLEQETPEQALDLMADLLQVRYERRGRVVTFVAR
jgi:ferric-dicitrate binding protein FerR (iron transport regulator)